MMNVPRNLTTKEIADLEREVYRSIARVCPPASTCTLGTLKQILWLKAQEDASVNVLVFRACEARENELDAQLRAAMPDGVGDVLIGYSGDWNSRQSPSVCRFAEEAR